MFTQHFMHFLCYFRFTCISLTGPQQLGTIHKIMCKWQNAPNHQLVNGASGDHNCCMFTGRNMKIWIVNAQLEAVHTLKRTGKKSHINLVVKLFSLLLPSRSRTNNKRTLMLVIIYCRYCRSVSWGFFSMETIASWQTYCPSILLSVRKNECFSH